jgi:hypothetical protein
MIKGLCAAVAGHPGWQGAGHWLFRAFDRIDVAAELEEAQVTRRAKGVALWEVLGERLKGRLADELAQLGIGPSISRSHDELVDDQPEVEPAPPSVVVAPPAVPRFEPPKGSGAATLGIRPHVNLAQSAAPAPSAEGTLRASILGAMVEGTFSAQGLATVLDAKELRVIETLAQLEREGLVVADRSAGSNSRFVRWSRASAGAAA